MNEKTFLYYVNHNLKKDYGVNLEDLMVPEEEALKGYQEEMSPREWVDWFAQKYDLLKIT